MKSYEVHRLMKKFTPNSSEALRKEVEDLLNQKAAAGFRVVTIDFEQPYSSGYIYAFIVLER